MRQHFIKHGYVDDYSQGTEQKGITGFHMERWLKRALKAINVTTWDNCCDDATVSPPPAQPVRFNAVDNIIETFDGVTWADSGMGTGTPVTYTANRALITDNTGATVVSATTNTEIGRLSGVTSNVQTQLNNKVTLVAAPATATDPGTAGEVAYDATHWYVCVATNTWVRTVLATF